MKKQSKFWNTFYLLASGGLILYVLSRFIKMKKPMIQKMKESKGDSLSFQDIYDWLKIQEGTPSRTAVKDGKLKHGTQLYSIGLGHQIQPNELNLLNENLTDQEIERIFAEDIAKILLSINKAIRVPVNKNQKLALISLRYNIGETAFNRSTLLRKLNSKDYIGASTHFAEWRLSEGKINKGLVNRRERERQLFLKPV